MKQKFNFQKIISILKKSDIISRVELELIDEIANRAVYKIRCNLIPSNYKLAIKFIRIGKDLFYSYQVFSDNPIIRWDNAPHFPGIESHPHHFHARDGRISPSEIKGNAVEDLPIILSYIKKALIEDQI